MEKLPLRLLPPPTINDSQENEAVDEATWMPGVRPTAYIQSLFMIGNATSSALFRGFVSSAVNFPNSSMKFTVLRSVTLFSCTCD